VINRVVLENFLPFRGRVELPLADQGLVLIKGRNEVSSAADSNMVGKTSIVHAICWGLFGEDLRGRKADAVACRFTDGLCSVWMEMDDALGVWSVMRTRRPTGLHTTGIPGVAENEDMSVTQGKIEQRLGFGVRTFKNAVVFGQGAFERYASADQAEQLRMLDEIQGVDFRDALKRAKEWRDGLQEQLRTAESDRDVCALRADEFARSIAEMGRMRGEHEADKARRLEGLAAARQRVSQQLDGIADTIRRSTYAEGTAKILRTELKRLQDLGDDVVRFDVAKSMAAGVQLGAADDLENMEERLDALLKEGTCPTCLQSVRAKERIRKLFEPDLVAARAAKREADAKHKIATKNHADMADRHRAQADKIALLKVLPDGADPLKYLVAQEHLCSPAARAANKSAWVACDVELRRIDDEVARERAAKWEGARALADSEAQAKELQAASQNAAKRAEKISVALRMADYAVEGYGDRGIRSMLVDGVAEFVNRKVAEHLEVLAGGEATTVMSAQTELKRGGSRERISFKTVWRDGGAGPDDGSGGQDQRKNLAVFAAMQDLAESRSARPFPVKVFDEPFDSLDARGKELAVEWLRRQARERGTVLLVTHSEEMAALVEPDHTWTVVMERGGSRVEVS